MVRDFHSYAEPWRVRLTHCSLRLDVDFERRQLSGTVELQLQRSDPDAPLVLDTRDLSIHSVSTDGSELDYSLSERDRILGSALRIHLPPNAASVLIRYSTSP